MTRPRRQRSDSIAAAVAAHQVATQHIDPPEPLPAKLMPIWHEIIGMRASGEWLALDLRLAVTLVRTLGSLEDESRTLSGEKLLKRTRHGLAPNPRLEIIAGLQRRVLALQSRLLLDPRASGFRSDRVAHQRQLEREARAKADPIGAYLAEGGDPMELLLGMSWPVDDPRFEILPTGGDGPVRGNGGRKPQ